MQGTAGEAVVQRQNKRKKNKSERPSELMLRAVLSPSVSTLPLPPSCFHPPLGSATRRAQKDRGGPPRETTAAWASTCSPPPSHAAPSLCTTTCLSRENVRLHGQRRYSLSLSSHGAGGRGRLSLGGALLARPVDCKSSEMSSYLSAIWQGTGYIISARKPPVTSLTPLLTCTCQQCPRAFPTRHTAG